MTDSGQPISWKDHRDTCQAYADMFHKREIGELEFRKKLKQLGFNPVEADNEVDAHRPK